MAEAFYEAVLSAFDRCDCHDELFYRTPATGWGHFALFATCSDTFYWATADAEEITPEDLPLLQSCVDDLMTIDEGGYLGMLFASRKRKMRPMDQVFIDDHAAPAAVQELLRAAGPERTPHDEDAIWRK